MPRDFHAKLFVAAILAIAGAGHALADVPALPPPSVDESVRDGATSETVVLAGGCFWGVQGVFQHVTGVTNAVSGYAGGDAATAHYQVVGSGMTGHAESG